METGESSRYSYFAQHTPHQNAGRIMDISSLLAKYNYKSYYSPEDGEYIALCAEFPQLEVMAPERQDAVRELQSQVYRAIEMILDEGQPLPKPSAEGTLATELLRRLGPEVQSDLVKRADYEGMSLQAYINTQLFNSLGGEGGNPENEEPYKLPVAQVPIMKIVKSN